MKIRYFPPVFTFFLLSLFLVSCVDIHKSLPSTSAATAEANEFGEVMTFNADTAPFPHPLRKQGYVQEDSFFPYHPHYDNSKVSVFIPKRFRAGFSTDLVVFLHGWYGSIDAIPTQFSVYRQFSESNANAVLVMPQGPWNAPDSFGGKFEDKGGFEAFVGEILSRLDGANVIRNTRLRSVVLIAHSGAYHAVSKILANKDLDGKIKEVYLFDALFGNLKSFGEWLMRGKGRFVALYSKTGETAANSAALMNLLSAKGIRYKTTADNPESDRKLRRGKILFVDSPNDHYGVLFKSDEIRRLLAKSSVLRHYIINS